MSRGGSGALSGQASGKRSRTPLAVRVVYGLGILAAALFLGAAVFWVSVYVASDEDVGLAVDPLPFVIWAGLIVLAATTWFKRHRRARR